RSRVRQQSYLLFQVNSMISPLRPCFARPNRGQFIALINPASLRIFGGLWLICARLKAGAGDLLQP
ncbi:MAG TPA: hypothetical protein VN824_18760, partial [Puia sp.]|nr:hypothetical protein [Puia sp.]